MAETTPKLATSGRSLRTVTGWTIFFMVLLRIAIGWHFFYEGAWKLMQDDWRATPYLVQASGPLRNFFRSMVKDVDGLETLTPEGMKERIDDRYDALVKYYGINDDKMLGELSAFKEAKKGLPATTTQPAQAAIPGPTVDSVFAEPDFQHQLEDYKTLLKEVEEQEHKLGTMAYEKERLVNMYQRKAAAKAAVLARAEVPLKAVEGEFLGKLQAAYLDAKTAGKTDEAKRIDAQLSKGLPPEPSPTKLIDWANMIGLTAVGVGLILGLFTRLSALGGVGLLMLYYLCMPPLPGLPESPASEGHYLIINKNIIEALALLMIATSRVGRWGGLDAFFGRRTVVAETPGRGG